MIRADREFVGVDSNGNHVANDTADKVQEHKFSNSELLLHSKTTKITNQKLHKKKTK